MKWMKLFLTSMMAFVIALTGVYTPQIVYGAETNVTTPQVSSAVLNNEMSVRGTNSFGDLFTDMAEEKKKEQEENQGYNVFSVTVANNQATITFETLEDCTLVVAVYDEAGRKMITSGSVEVKKDENSAVAELDGEAMPQYFYLRCFMVENTTMRPLCTEYASPNYTKEMQELFAKTIHDFDSKRVLNLDSDETDNFAVFNDDVTLISHKEGKNRVTEDKEKGTYVIENADESFTTLEKGELVSYDQGNGDILIFKAEDIEIKDNTVTVKTEDTSMEEVFSHVKVSGKSNASTAKVDSTTCQLGTQYQGLVENKIEPVNSGEFALSFTFLDKELLSQEDNGVSKVKLNGSIELAINTSVKLYITSSYLYFEMSMDYSFAGNLGISGKITGADIPLATLGFSPVAGVYIEITPSFVMEGSGAIKFSVSLEGSVGFSVSSKEGVKNLTSTPKVKTELKGEATIFVGLSLKPKVAVISEKISKVSFEATIGGELTAKFSEQSETSLGTSKKLPDKIHNCEGCLDGDIAVKAEISVETKLLNSDRLKFSYTKKADPIKIADFYWSIDRGEFGFGSCPYICWKVELRVKDKNKNPVEDMKTFPSPKGSQKFEILKDTDKLAYADELVTNSKGKAVGYLPNGTYKIAAENDMYSGSKKVTVKDKAQVVKVTVGNALPIVKSYAGTVAVITGDGSLYMWGYNGYGQVGDGTKESRPTPIKVLDNVATVDINNHTMSAITKTGELYMWGCNFYGAVGDGNPEDRLTPIKILDNVATVDIDNYTTSAITKDGELYMWGQNNHGQVGDGTKESRLIPIKILDNVATVDVAGYNTSAITKTGELYRWGYNSDGQIGDGTYEDRLTPIKILDNVATVDIDNHTVSAITKTGELYMWGRNSYGQVGDGTYEDRLTPIKILDNVATVDVARRTTSAITKTGELYMWGANDNGQVGDGSKDDKVTPIKILDNIEAVSVNDQSTAATTAAVTKAGELYMWGANDDGQVGDGTKEKYRLIPTKVLDHVTSISSSYGTIGAITEAGELYMWGYNNYGQVGDGTNKNRFTPIKVLDNVAVISMANYLTGAITKAGELYMWGANSDGRVGNGTTENVYTPTQISLPYDSAPIVSTKTKQKVNTVSINSDAGTNNTIAENQITEPANIHNIVTTGENGNATGLIPDTTYNYYVMKSKSGQQPFAADNLLYIGQAVSDASGNLHIDHEVKEEYADSETIVVGMAQLQLSDDHVTVSDVIYNGEEQDICPAVTYQGIELEEGKDYEVSGDFTAEEIGEYTITIEGTRYYTGAVRKNYKVYTDEETPTLNPTQTPVTQEPTAEVSVTPTLDPSSQPDLIPTPEPSGQPSLLPTPEPSGQPGLTPTPIPEPSKTASPTSKPKTKYKKMQKTYGDKKFSIAIKKESLLKYKSDESSVATVNEKGMVTIKGCGKSNISIIDASTGHIYQNISLTVVPKKPSLSTKKTSAKKVLKVKWKKVSKADGYEIYYANNKTFSKKTAILVNSKTTKKTVKNLKSGKKYYVKIRAYKKWNGTKLKGSFSKTVSIKVK